MTDNSNMDKQSDKTLANTAFKMFQPIQPGPPSVNFWAQQNELSEMLKKNSARGASFKLQPSIINVSAFKESEKLPISDFSTNAHLSTRGRKPRGSAHKEDSDRKAHALVINKFEPHKPSEQKAKPETERKVDTLIDDMDTEVKKQILDHQFDSEAEDIHDFMPLDADFKGALCFVDKDRIALINRKIGKASKKIYNLVEFIKKRENDTNDVKTYACKYCPKVFVRRAALGGHTAKNHPHQSDSYRIRQESLKNRRIERERFDYFKTIEHQASI